MLSDTVLLRDHEMLIAPGGMVFAPRATLSSPKSQVIKAAVEDALEFWFLSSSQ